MKDRGLLTNDRLCVRHKLVVNSPNPYTTNGLFFYLKGQPSSIGNEDQSSIFVTPPEIANFIASVEVISVISRTLSFFTKYRWPANA
jgi:hypothetical protein